MRVIYEMTRMSLEVIPTHKPGRLNLTLTSSAVVSGSKFSISTVTGPLSPLKATFVPGAEPLIAIGVSPMSISMSKSICAGTGAGAFVVN